MSYWRQFWGVGWEEISCYNISRDSENNRDIADRIFSFRIGLNKNHPLEEIYNTEVLKK